MINHYPNIHNPVGSFPNTSIPNESFHNTNPDQLTIEIKRFHTFSPTRGRGWGLGQRWATTQDRGGRWRGEREIGEGAIALFLLKTRMITSPLYL